MRLILRNYLAYVKPPFQSRRWYPLDIPPYLQRQLDQYELKNPRQPKKPQESYQTNGPQSLGITEIRHTDDINELAQQLQWETAAPHLMIADYKVLEPINRSQLAKQKLKSYEDSLNLSVQHTIQPRLTNERYIKERQAQIFLHRMTPLSNIFLEQGVNFLNGHVFSKLVFFNKLSILKDLLNKGAFETANFVHEQFLQSFLPHFINDPRRQFLLNIICFQEPLINIDYKKQVYQQEEDEEEEEWQKPYFGKGLRGQELQQALQEGFSGLLSKCLDVTINNRKDLNRLRIFWSLKKSELNSEKLFPLIMEQLTHVHFKVGDLLQEEVKKEMNFISKSSYSSPIFGEFVLSLFTNYKTFHKFITAYTLAILALSKLRSIKRMLPQSMSNQLHPIFQLIQFNLPKEENQKLILSIFQLLNHESHSRIQFQNFKRSYNYWLKDYTQPQKTKYHSPLTRVLQNNEEPLVILYERNPEMPEYAKFRHTLTRNKESKQTHPYFHQRDMIKHLIKKDYEPVLKYFITTYGLSAPKNTYRKFQTQMKKIDSKASFKSKNEEALYKLKVAHNIFFNQSLPQPLNRQKLTRLKSAYDASIIISDLLITPDQYLTQHQLSRNFFQAFQHTKVQTKKGARWREKLAQAQRLKQKQKLDLQNAEKPPVQQEAVAAQPEEVEGVEGVEGTVEAVQGQGEAYEEAEVQEVVMSEEEKQKVRLERIKNDEQELKKDYIYLKLFGQLRCVNQTQEEQQKRVQQGFQFEYNNLNIYQFYFESITPTDGEEDGEFEDDQYFFDLQSQSQDSSQNSSSSEADSEQDSSSMKAFFKRKANKQKQEALNNSPEQSLKEEPSTQIKSPFARATTLNKKNQFQFCTFTQRPHPIDNVEVLDATKISQLRQKEVDRNFLSLLQTQQHVSHISSGSNIAKYLFLHGKNKNNNFVLRPNKTLNIQFTSVVGTRAKNYQKYVRNSLFRYNLSQNLYEQLLLGQLKKYNRFEFKSTVAHLICYNDHINDNIIATICRICDKQKIGYTFVEIAQLIKFNDIRISSQSLEEIANLWQRFEVINEDMFSFVRQYCRKMQIPIKTQFYARYCKSLIKTKNFPKLELIMGTVLNEIRPKQFKIDNSMNNFKADQVAAIQKEWKAKEQQNYLRLYLQLIEVVVKSLQNTVPAYLSIIFDQYRKMKPDFNEKEFGYAFICYANKREKVQELLNRLDKQGEKGTSFMYDCLLQTILSNFQGLEQLSEKILDVTILKNRVVLSNEQIMKSLIVFKRSSSSNSFSKFLDHCLRFQEGIDKSNEIKRQMFFILNNNVEDVSAGGIFNLLDFIFNEKREKERIEYRAIKLSEEEKSRKLQEIQQATTKVVAKKEVQKVQPKKDKKKTKKGAEQETPKELQAQGEKKKQQNEEKSESEQQKKVAPTKKEQKKKIKKQKSQERQKHNDLFDQIMAQQQAKNITQASGSNSDQEFIQLIKSQTKKHESSRRKSLLSMGTIFQGSLQLSREEEATRAKQLQKKNEKKEPEQKKKGDKKGKGDKKK